MADPEILLVDDERDILELGVTALREAGYAVQPASNGDIALVLIEQGVHFRLLITDIVMPGVLDGFALARRARDVDPSLPIIYTTGFARVASVRSPGAPYGDTLRKPWRPSELLKVVAGVLREPAKG
jgi:two-component system, cell cycle sensor histidine kinase and response regulator CckA